MSDVPQMRKPWSVVGAGFNDEGVYFTFDDTVIHRSDIDLMQAAPELLEALQEFVGLFPDVIDGDAIMPALDKGMAAIAKALGQ